MHFPVRAFNNSQLLPPDFFSLDESISARARTYSPLLRRAPARSATRARGPLNSGVGSERGVQRSNGITMTPYRIFFTNSPVA